MVESEPLNRVSKHLAAIALAIVIFLPLSVQADEVAVLLETLAAQKVEEANNLKAAIAHLDKALKLNSTLKNPKGEFDIYLEMEAVLFKKHDYPKIMTTLRSQCRPYAPNRQKQF